MTLNELIAKLEEIRDELKSKGIDTDVKVMTSSFEFYEEVKKVRPFHLNDEDGVLIEGCWPETLNGYETL
jgi:hypothetical protein